jgi:hypothetical protein
MLCDCFGCKFTTRRTLDNLAHSFEVSTRLEGFAKMVHDTPILRFSRGGLA